MHDAHSFGQAGGSGYSTNVIDLGGPSSSHAPRMMSRRAAAHNSDDSGSMSNKKRKMERACDACRRKKTRCDGPSKPDNVCSNCAQLHKDCTYVEASKPRGPPKMYVVGLEDRVEELEALIERLYPGADFSDELGPRVIRDSWRDDHPMHTTIPRPPKVQRRRSISTTQPSQPTNPPLRPPRYSVSLAPLRPYPSGRFPPTETISSTHLLTQPPSRVRRRTQRQPDGGMEADGESTEDNSSSDVDRVDTLNLTRGRKHLTYRGLESVDDSSASASAVDSQMRFHGKSSLFELIGETMKLKEMHRSSVREEGMRGNDPPRRSPSHANHRRPEYWTTPPWELAWEGCGLPFNTMLPFPPPDLVHSLFGLYFTHTNTQFPLLHLPTFERQWRAGLQFRDQWFACLAFTVFAVAARWSDDERVLDASLVDEDDDADSTHKKWYRAGRQWYQAAMDITRAHRSIVYPPCLFEVQSLILLGMFTRSTLAGQSASWMFISVGLRKAQDVGAHRKMMYTSTPTVEQELWKRAFWLLVAFDRIGSTIIGRPCCAGEEDFDIDLPLEVDDDFWETGDPATDFQQPPGKPALVAAFNIWIHLTQIQAFVLKTIYASDKAKVLLTSGAPNWRAELTSQINTALNDWVDTVPAHLRWSDKIENPIFANQSFTLHTTYHLLRILVNRPFMASTVAHRLNPPSSSIDALDTCAQAAQSCARIVKAQLRRGVSNIPNLLRTSHICAALLSMYVWDLKGRERAQREAGMVVDMKPPLEVTVEILQSDIKTFMQALELALPKWELAAENLRELRESLPTSAPPVNIPPPQPSQPTKQKRSIRPDNRPGNSPSTSSSSHRSTPQMSYTPGTNTTLSRSARPPPIQLQPHLVHISPAPSPHLLSSVEPLRSTWQKPQLQRQEQEQFYAEPSPEQRSSNPHAHEDWRREPPVSRYVQNISMTRRMSASSSRHEGPPTDPDEMQLIQPGEFWLPPTPSVDQETRWAPEWAPPPTPENQMSAPYIQRRPSYPNPNSQQMYSDSGRYPPPGQYRESYQ